MAYKAAFTKRFIRGFEAVIETYMYVYEYPSSAKRIKDMFLQEMENVKNFPELYPLHKETHKGSDCSYRYFTIYDYLFLYNIDKENETVLFQDIVHGKKQK